MPSASVVPAFSRRLRCISAHHLRPASRVAAVFQHGLEQEILKGSPGRGRGGAVLQTRPQGPATARPNSRFHTARPQYKLNSSAEGPSTDTNFHLHIAVPPGTAVGDLEPVKQIDVVRDAAYGCFGSASAVDRHLKGCANFAHAGVGKPAKAADQDCD